MVISQFFVGQRSSIIPSIWRKAMVLCMLSLLSAVFQHHRPWLVCQALLMIPSSSSSFPVAVQRRSTNRNHQKSINLRNHNYNEIPLYYFSPNQEDKLLSSDDDSSSSDKQKNDGSCQQENASTNSMSSTSNIYSSSRSNNISSRTATTRSLPTISTTTTTPHRFIGSNPQEKKKKAQEIARQWEAEIVASSKEKTDVRRIEQWLQNPPSSSKQQLQLQQQQHPADGWKVALTAGIVCGVACEWFSESTLLSISVFVVVFLAALRDPLDDDDLAVAGSLARIIGRTVLKRYQESQPKIKAVARAAVQGEDEAWTALQAEVETLRNENRMLRQYQQRREWIDVEQSYYTLEELKILAQRYNIGPYSSLTKSQLMMRLLQGGALNVTMRGGMTTKATTTTNTSASTTSTNKNTTKK